MFKNFLNIASIRGKLVLSFLFYIVIICFIIIIFLFHNKKIEQVKQTTYQLERLYTKTLELIKVERDFISFESLNVDFYKSEKSENLITHKKLLDSLKIDMATLRHHADRDITVTSLQLSYTLDNYQKTFDQLVLKLKARGFKDYGLEGKMRTYAHELENRGKDLNMVKILSLRRNEKDFLLRNELVYVNKVKTLADNIKIEIRTNNKLTDIDKKSIEEILNNYISTFNQLVKAKKEIGIGDTEGLNRTLNNYSKSIFKDMETMISDARKRESNVLSHLKYTFIAIIGICLIACIVFSYFISIKLTQPIKNLSDVISHVHKGNFNNKVSLISNNSQDEIGVLTRNFNGMVDLIRNSFTEIKEKNVRLEIQNLKLTSINEKVAASEKSLQESNAIKDKFFSIIAHDLKGPLATITSFLQIMINYADGFTEEERTKLAKDMHKSVENLSALLENLLQWARSQMGHLDFNPKKFPLNRSVQKTFDLLHARSAGKLIEMQSNLDDNIMVYADENMLDFVMRNLLSNSLKFTKPGGKIEVNVSYQDPLIEVTVLDNGIGIPHEDLDKLFRTDYHLTKPGTSKEEGTGLGLILCKEFVEKNGGTIWVESRMNVGTEFKFTLQLVNELVNNNRI